MWQIFIGSLVLSLIHTTIPNHWIPLVAISKTEKWTLKETLSATAIAGFAHTLSTILVGVVVGLVGIELTASYSMIMRYVAPSILMAIGILYIILDFKGQRHHNHAALENSVNRNGSKSRWAIISSLSLVLFLTPCVEIEAYYFQAGRIGWAGIIIVSAVYTIISVIVMLILVYAGYKGVQRLRLHLLEHHEKLITGTVLIVLGVFAFFVDF